MDQKPWYQKRKVDPSFPFLFKDNTFHNYAFHWHELLEFVYILQGKIHIIVEGKAYHAAKGDIVIINSGVIHGFLDADPDTIVSTYQFGVELFDQTLIDIRERASQKLVFSRKLFVNHRDDGDIHRRLEEMLLSIRSEYYAKEEGFRLAIRTRLYELTLIFLREIPKRELLPGESIRRNYNHQILERVFSFVHDNFCNPGITLEHAANAAALSKFHFARYFKQQTGQTFHAYLSRLRVNLVEEYLSESDLPITDIAYQCGFASLKTFNRLFKAYTGTSPSVYRFGRLDKTSK
jgi:AraC-like DNA-binding protein